MKNLAESLKNKRTEKGLSQTKLAQLAGLSGKDVISKYERGERKPTLETLARIAEILDCEVIVTLDKKNKRTV